MAILGAGAGGGGAIFGFIVFLGMILMFISTIILFHNLQYYPDDTLIQHKDTINSVFAGLMMITIGIPLGIVTS